MKCSIMSDCEVHLNHRRIVHWQHISRRHFNCSRIANISKVRSYSQLARTAHVKAASTKDSCVSNLEIAVLSSLQLLHPIVQIP